MPRKYWIKLFIEILDDPKMGRLPDRLWRRLVELFLLAGRHADDGTLPPVEEMAWTLRLSPGQMLEDLHGLAEIGVINACPKIAGDAQPEAWMVTHFKQRQSCESSERVKRYRERYRNGQSNAGVAAGASTSTSSSDSDSDSKEEGAAGEELPRSPVEAMLQPDVRVFNAVTGRIPGLSQYQAVIEAVRFLRARQGLDDAGLVAWLIPYWLAWSTRKRLDGRRYDPSNLTWLTEWALNACIPPQSAPKAGEPPRPAVPSPEETRRMLAEKDQISQAAVPPPKELRAKIQDLKGKLESKASP
ncbi:MAG: hypothetical protein WCE68_01770 [Anaerolineales bacterium]